MFTLISDRRAANIERLLASLIHKLDHMENVMATAADVKAKTDALLTRVQANTDATSSVVTYVAGLKAQLTDIQAQLAAALAAGDQTSIDAASDALDTAITSIDADTVAEAALANTPAAP